MNETQERFLISTDITRWLEKQTYTLEKTEQFYVKTDTNSTCYFIRHFPDIYVKVMIDKDAQKEKTLVDEDVYIYERKKHLGRKIVKQAYRVERDMQVFVFYEYHKKFKGLYILEASFKDGKTMRESKTLESLQPFILKDIRKDKKYDDALLSICVKPMEYNLDKLFDKIDAYEPANLFFWQVPQRIYVRDGVALILYRNMRLLQHYKVNYQKKHFSASLHRLRVIMRRTATLLETFSSLFNPNIQQFCTEMLLHFHERTKLLRYLYFLEELYATCEDTKISIHSELKRLVEGEHRNVSQMFLSQPFVQMIQILTREIQEQDHPQCKALKKEVKIAARQHLATLEALLQKTREGHDEVLLEQLYTSMDSIQTLIEDFFYIIGENEVKILVDELNILLKPLREYRNCKERERIMHSIAEQSDKNIFLEDNPLLCTNIDELEAKIAHALKLLRVSKFYV